MSASAHVDQSVRFREVAARLPTGVTVLSTLVDGEPHAMTVNTFTSISLEPLLVLVSVNNSSRSRERIERSGAFAVTVLGAGQQQVAHRFASSSRPVGDAELAGIQWRPAPYSRSPILLDGIGYFDCVVDRIHLAGDHTIVLGEVRAMDVLSDRPPLLFVRSRLTQLPDHC